MKQGTEVNVWIEEECCGRGWKQDNEKLHNLYSSPNIITKGQTKENEIARECSTHGGREMRT
jgi:hypothetical protein